MINDAFSKNEMEAWISKRTIELYQEISHEYHGNSTRYLEQAKKLAEAEYFENHPVIYKGVVQPLPPNKPQATCEACGRPLGYCNCGSN